MSTNPTSTRALFRRAWALSPGLVLGTGVMALGTLLALCGLALDARQLLGEPIWLKPFKFYVSFVLYNATLLYVLAFIPGRERFVRRLGAVLSVCGVVELVCITLQAARGVRSHFNLATLFDALVFQVMGLAVVVLWVAMMVLAVTLLRTRVASPALASALRLGLGISVVGMGLGFLMTAPHNGQLEALKAGTHLLERGAHSFGGADGGPGIRLVGWSLTAGDMRPAHFLGLHALQALPVLAALLARRRVRSELHERAWIRAAGAAWLGLTLTLALQAWRGLPLVQWDAVCMLGLAGTLAASLTTLALSLPRRQALAQSVA